MKSPLHILHLENDPENATRVQATLEAGGILCATIRVQNRDDFVAALERGGTDLVLADFWLPKFDGLSATIIVRARWPALPVILVSGTPGEEQAVDSIKSGATDYVLKQRLARLVPAVRRAMQEVARAELHRTEKLLQSARDFTEASLNSLPGTFYLYDEEGNLLRWNRNLERVTGYNTGEIARMKALDFFAGDERDHMAKKMKEVFALGAATAEAHFTAKDGTRVPYFFTGHKIQMEGKLCLIGTGVDISERKQLEAQFIEAQKMEVVGQLAGGVAHDFNNILAIIMGFNSVLVSRLGPESPLQKYAGEILHASERAAALTRQLLVFSRKQTVQPVVLNLNDAVKDLDNMLRRLIDENIELTFDLGNQIGRIKADPGYLGQVLMNLVVNARDAMPNGGKLTIATSRAALDEKFAQDHAGAIPGDYVMLRVSDTGTGMTPEVKARMFEAFFTTKPKGKGTGLGLATCQAIVKQSGGYIEVSSEPDRGATFQVYFPCVQQPLDVLARPVQTGPVPRGAETLLFVEDEPTLRRLICSALEGQGYRVLRAGNGQEGLRAARDYNGQPLRLVITDVIMPQMGGKAMVEQLKAIYPDLKILFTSGYTDDGIGRHGIIEPGIAFLPKPYTPTTLAWKVREVLDQPAS